MPPDFLSLQFLSIHGHGSVGGWAIPEASVINRIKTLIMTMLLIIEMLPLMYGTLQFIDYTLI